MTTACVKVQQKLTERFMVDKAKTMEEVVESKVTKTDWT